MKKDFVYLASASPRRSELLRQIGVPFEVRPADIAEEPAAPARRPRPMSCASPRPRPKPSGPPSRRARAPVLAADTAVVLDGAVLGKPADAAEAAAMLERLSGRTHRVLTAVALRHAAGARDAAQRQRSEIPRHDGRGARARTVQRASRSTRRAAMASRGTRPCSSRSSKAATPASSGLPLFETAALLTRCGVGFWLTARAA